MAPDSASAAPLSTTTDPAQAAAGWLAGRLDGGTHVTNLGFFDGGTTADVVFGLAAAGVGKSTTNDVLDFLQKPANADSYADLSAQFGGPYTGSAAKAALAFLVGGRDPSSVAAGGLSLTQAMRMECASVDVSATATHYCPAVGAGLGTFSSVSQSFIVLTSARLGTPLDDTGAAMIWFRSLQCPNGGFTVDVPEKGCASNASADVDATAYALMALTSILSPSATDTAAATAAADWLVTSQNRDGSWTSQKVHNTDSTGLAAAALAGAGRNTRTARAWLREQQITGGPTVGPGATRGALSYAAARDEHSRMKATADGLLGLGAAPLGTLTASHSIAGAPVLALSAPRFSGALHAGGTVRLTASGFQAKEKVRVQIHSTPVTLATVPASSSGSVSTSVVLPTALAAGTHTVTVTGQTSTLAASATVTVAAAAASTSSGSGGATTSTPLAATGTDGRQLATVTAAALLLLLSGGALLVTGRRRERNC
jgi:A-macroglobulin TED domain